MRLPEVIRKQWQFLDAVTNRIFNKGYFNATDRERTFIHETINGETGRHGDEIQRFVRARQSIGDLLEHIPVNLRN